MLTLARLTKQFIYLAIMLVALGSAIASASYSLPVDSLDEVTQLKGSWKFTTGDDLAWADPAYDDSQWQPISIAASWTSQGHPDYNGFAWYRITLQFDLNQLDLTQLNNSLALYTGRVQSAYEIYVGGMRIGGLGGLPPNEKIEYGKRLLLEIPPGAVDDNGKMVIAVRVWRSPVMNRFWSAGLSGSDPWLIGKAINVNATDDYRDMAILLVASMYLFIGFYHIYMYRRNRTAQIYLWFGLCTVDMAIYAFSISQLVWQLPISFEVKKQLEYSSIFLQAPLAMRTVSLLLNIKFARILNWIAYLFCVLAVVVIVLPTFSVFVPVLSVWQHGIVVFYFVMALYLLRVVFTKDSAYRLVAVGAVAAALSAAIAVLSEQEVLLTPNVILIGYFLFMLCIVISLADDITRLLSNLEQQVAVRTDDLTRVNDDLERAVRVDDLTAIPNRKAFVEALDKAQKSFSPDKPMTLVLADIDYFKQINDSYGHFVGDKVLEQIASYLFKEVGEEGYVARWGGEEFILLLENSDAKTAMLRMEKLRASIERQKFVAEDKELHLTVTFGLCEYTGGSIDNCIHQADNALYMGKNSGRNRVINFSSQAAAKS